MFFKDHIQKLNGASAPVKCVIFNGIVIFGIVIVILLDEESFKRLVNIGPSDDFYVMGILPINTWLRYLSLILSIFIMKASVNMGDEIGWSPIKMQLCNPESNVIIGYSESDLYTLIYTLMFEKIFIKFILTLIMISRLDIGIICVLADLTSKKLSYDHLISKKQIRETILDEPQIAPSKTEEIYS
jgi:hypothetical protein